MSRKIILACTGSVAAIKVPEIAEELAKLPQVNTILHRRIYTVILIIRKYSNASTFVRGRKFLFPHKAVWPSKTAGVTKVFD